MIDSMRKARLGSSLSAPRVKVMSINPLGNLFLEFDQKMLRPKSVSPSLYGNVLQVSLVSGSLETDVIAEFRAGPDKARALQTLSKNEQSLWIEA